VARIVLDLLQASEIFYAFGVTPISAFIHRFIHPPNKFGLFGIT
jgi:hypothetical protein